MRTFLTVVTVAALAAVGACTPDGAEELDVDDDVQVFLIDEATERLEPVSRLVIGGSGACTPEDRAVEAVEALLAPKEDDNTLWDDACRPGAELESVAVVAERVTVTLTGPGGPACDLTVEGDILRQQQLAWTLADHLDLDRGVTIRVLSDDGRRVWDDTVADPDYLAS